MDALIFNSAIRQIINFAQQQLVPRGFQILEAPELQEDSGDLVSTESMSFTFPNPALGLEMCFFLCCGKGGIEDFLTMRFVDLNNKTNFVDGAKLSESLCGCRLHLLDFNEHKQPIQVFLETYLFELQRSLPLFLEVVPHHLAQCKPSTQEGFRLF